MVSLHRCWVGIWLGWMLACGCGPAWGQGLRLLVLGGSSGSHRPAEMVRLAQPALAAAQIEVDYTQDTALLTGERLATADALLIYKDDGELTSTEEAALLAFVRGGRGLVAVHCASHAFRASEAYTRLVGGRFHHHGGEEFRATIVDAQHPAVRGERSFVSWDETYVHDQLAADRRVLLCRPEAGGYEPYAWVRHEGPGRVYYTALGHDHRTWSHPDFHGQLIAAIRWAAGKLVDEPSPAPPDQPAPYEAPLPPPLSVAESQARMHLPEGFRVELFAAEPDVVKPLAMTFDERGRLWVIESVDYPNTVLEPDAGHDRIKICEDTDGDGRADKFTVFAEGLNIPTGLLRTGRGVVVARAPDLLYLEDSDGDDRADRRTVLYSGFGRFDTHAVHSNLHYGFDNWLWATVGYSGIELTVGDRAIKTKQGVFRCRLDGSAFEVLTPTSNNTWGLGFSETGDVFASTANNQHSVHLAIPNRFYESVRGWHGVGSAGIEDHKLFHHVADDLRQVDVHGGYTAASGHELYTARAFPREYWNRVALVCEPTGHLIHLDWLVRRGSGFVARDGYNLVASRDPWTSPIAAQVGPDGAVWWLDWYNFIVRHNPTPPGYETGPGNAYVTPQRDQRHGRIYRIVHESAPVATPRRLDPADVPGLLATLGDDNLFWRLQAQRLLVERGELDVVPELVGIVRRGLSEKRAEDPASVHAIGVLGGLNAIEEPEVPDVLRAAGGHPAPAVRRQALAHLPHEMQALASLLSGSRLRDRDPGVRLAAALCLAEMPVADYAARAVVALAADPSTADDPWLPQATVAAAARHDEHFLTAALEWTGGTTPTLENTCRIVAEHWARAKPTTLPAGWLAGLVRAEPGLAGAIVEGLQAGWPAAGQVANERELSPEDAGRLAALLPRLAPEPRLALVRLATRWGLAERVSGELARLRQTLLARVLDTDSDPQARLATLRQVVTLDMAPEELEALLATLTPQAAGEWNAGLLAALASGNAPDTARAVLARWSGMTPQLRRAAVGLCLTRPAWTADLLQALEARQITRQELSVDELQQLVTHPRGELAERARALMVLSGGLVSSDRQGVLAEFLPLADEAGSAAAGRAVFEKNCAKCHRHGELGAAIGPDLTGIAVRPRREILTEVLDPNRSVEGNFRQYLVETTDGRVFTGLVLNENQTSLEVLDSQAQRQVVLREAIESLVASERSVMPEGFEKLPRQELIDLVEFLAARGRYLPLSLAKAATIASDRGMFYSRDNPGERLVFPAWGPQSFEGIPFQVLDPQVGTQPNAILLHGPEGAVSAAMPATASVACGLPARAIHLLGGVSGWGFPLGERGSVSLVVRLHYADGQTEDHPLKNGEHLADYVRPIEVPGSRLAFALEGRQVRYLAITPGRREAIERIEFLKGPDRTAPLVLAVTIEPGG